ncbi:MAG: hypothetical protein LQ350_005253 [Teloschistes chrysophthalmus]|nr:MAG: hypothetical protein LQ350_005253 [Niorma chrysophthalma]
MKGTQPIPFHDTQAREKRKRPREDVVTGPDHGITRARTDQATMNSARGTKPETALDLLLRRLQDALSHLSDLLDIIARENSASGDGIDGDCHVKDGKDDAGNGGNPEDDDQEALDFVHAPAYPDVPNKRLRTKGLLRLSKLEDQHQADVGKRQGKLTKSIALLRKFAEETAPVEDEVTIPDNYLPHRPDLHTSDVGDVNNSVFSACCWPHSVMTPPNKSETGSEYQWYLLISWGTSTGNRDHYLSASSQLSTPNRTGSVL